MTPRVRAQAVIVGAGLLASSLAAAQVGPGPVPTGGPAGAEEEVKPEGVAESAPRTQGMLPTTPTLPPAKGKRNRFELFELDGYFRFRGDYFKNFNLSYRDDPTLGGSPFPRPIGCAQPSEETPGDRMDRPCGDTVKSANMRLRLEPTINLNETTQIHTQIDVLDNMVMGSSTTGDSPLDPGAGTNNLADSIAVKRAWAEITTPLGILKFGRQPEHWGMGIYYNGAGEDPINGGYDLDGDLGDTVDRVSVSTLIPGTKLRGAVAMDWPVNGPSSATTTEGADRPGQPWDLDDNDDATRYVFVLSHLESPQDFSDKVDRGELALNYGVHFAYSTQSWDYSGETQGDAVNPDLFVPRGAKLYVPDVWLKLGWKKLQLEVEALTIFGSVNHLSDLEVDDSVDLRSWGAVARGSYRALDDKLKFGLELGAASGDQWDNEVQGETHLSGSRFGNGDDTYSRMIFDPDYKVDLIMFRELFGAVSNAFYAKPFMSYELTKSIALKVSNVTSFALKPVSTPGNATMYGTEFDADIGYSGGGIYAGLAYGLLFPLTAMDHPADSLTAGGDGFGYGDNSGGAGNAHTLQLRLVVQF